VNSSVPRSGFDEREIVLWVAGVTREGQRALVVAGAARLELAFENLLKHVMKGPTNGDKRLFGPDGPLGTLSAKIALSHRLGLIDDDMRHCCGMIRRIRNDFAHSAGVARLSHSPHLGRLRELRRICSRVRDWEMMVGGMRMQTGASDEVIDFASCLAVLVVLIEVMVSTASPMEPTAFVFASFFFDWDLSSYSI
jgi:hypothetical protein